MTRSQLPTATNQDCLPAFISLPCAQYPQPNSPQDSIAPEVRVPIREADRATTLRRLCPELPAICQQLSLTSPQPAPCRFIAICVLSSIDIRQRVDACCGASGWLVNGMQGVRGSNPLSSTTTTPQVSGSVLVSGVWATPFQIGCPVPVDAFRGWFRLMADTS